MVIRNGGIRTAQVETGNGYPGQFGTRIDQNLAICSAGRDLHDRLRLAASITRDVSVRAEEAERLINSNYLCIRACLHIDYITVRSRIYTPLDQTGVGRHEHLGCFHAHETARGIVQFVRDFIFNIKIFRQGRSCACFSAKCCGGCRQSVGMIAEFDVISGLAAECEVAQVAAGDGGIGCVVGCTDRRMLNFEPGCAASDGDAGADRQLDGALVDQGRRVAGDPGGVVNEAEASSAAAQAESDSAYASMGANCSITKVGGGICIFILQHDAHIHATHRTAADLTEMIHVHIIAVVVHIVEPVTVTSRGFFERRTVNCVPGSSPILRRSNLGQAHLVGEILRRRYRGVHDPEPSGTTLGRRRHLGCRRRYGDRIII